MPRLCLARSKHRSGSEFPFLTPLSPILPDCPEGQVQCSKTKKCISESDKCNFINDCYFNSPFTKADRSLLNGQGNPTNRDGHDYGHIYYRYGYGYRLHSDYGYGTNRYHGGYGGRYGYGYALIDVEKQLSEMKQPQAEDESLDQCPGSSLTPTMSSWVPRPRFCLRRCDKWSKRHSSCCCSCCCDFYLVVYVVTFPFLYWTLWFLVWFFLKELNQCKKCVWPSRPLYQHFCQELTTTFFGGRGAGGQRVLF